MNFPVLTVALTILFGLVSCAAPPALTSARNEVGVVCCESFEQLPYRSVVANATVRMEIDVGAPSFVFPEGTSRFAAFKLPDGSSSQKVRIKSTIVGTHMPEAFVFYPGITFLDDRHKQIQYLNPKMTFEGSFMGSTESMGWATEIVVPNLARYFVLHTASDSPGRLFYNDSVQSPVSSIVPTGRSIIFSPGNWWDVYLPTSWAGRIQVTLTSTAN